MAQELVWEDNARLRPETYNLPSTRVTRKKQQCGVAKVCTVVYVKLHLMRLIDSCVDFVLPERT